MRPQVVDQPRAGTTGAGRMRLAPNDLRAYPVLSTCRRKYRRRAASVTADREKADRRARRNNRFAVGSELPAPGANMAQARRAAARPAAQNSGPTAACPPRRPPVRPRILRRPAPSGCGVTTIPVVEHRPPIAQRPLRGIGKKRSCARKRCRMNASTDSRSAYSPSRLPNTRSATRPQAKAMPRPMRSGFLDQPVREHQRQPVRGARQQRDDDPRRQRQCRPSSSATSGADREQPRIAAICGQGFASVGAAGVAGGRRRRTALLAGRHRARRDQFCATQHVATAGWAAGLSSPTRKARLSDAVRSPPGTPAGSARPGRGDDAVADAHVAGIGTFASSMRSLRPVP